MRIVIAPQEFKGSLSARQAAEAIAAGVRRAAPTVEVDLVPMADGGPGTVEAIVTARAGCCLTTTVAGPLAGPVDAAWGLIDDGRTAVIEAAAACSLALLAEGERDPRRATTYGVGQLTAAALDKGCRSITIGVGGSATNDGGAGMAQALGALLLDAEGRELPPGGAALARLARIDTSHLDPRLRHCEVQVACDVSNPLLGPQGATAVYGPQKGATSAMVAEMEAALRHYAAVVARDVGMDVAELPGAGAAGGLAAGLAAFLGAQLVPGAELVAEAIGLERRLAAASLVITGEGRIDGQTGFGKGPLVVARLARKCRLPVVAIVGSASDDAYVLHDQGIDAIFSIVPGPMALPETMANAYDLTARAAEEVMRLVLTASHVFEAERALP